MLPPDFLLSPQARPPRTAALCAEKCPEEATASGRPWPLPRRAPCPRAEAWTVLMLHSRSLTERSVNRLKLNIQLHVRLTVNPKRLYVKYCIFLYIYIYIIYICICINNYPSIGMWKFVWKVPQLSNHPWSYMDENRFNNNLRYSCSDRSLNILVD